MIMQVVYDYCNGKGGRMGFIEVHPKVKPAELLLLNVSDIEYAYQSPEDSGAVIRLHGDGRKYDRYE